MFFELGSTRLYSGFGDKIVEIRGRRYLVAVHVRDDEGRLCGVTLRLCETDELETAWKSWSQESAVQKEIDYLERAIVEDALDEEFVRRSKVQIDGLRCGEIELRPSCAMAMFGQPRFVQEAVRPVYDDPVYNLATLEVDWSDSGNVNVMVALDADGVPCRAWWEASSC